MTFGHPMLAHWALDPTVLYLNHGTVGATPRRVLARQQAIRDAMERQPSRFMLREVSAISVGHPWPVPRLREAAERIAPFLGARGADLVFVDNATAGVNAVLRSLAPEPGDTIVLADQGYGAIAHAARYAARSRGASVQVVTLPSPARAPEPFVEAYAAALGPRTRLAIVDHVSSSPGLVLPVAEIVACCRARGVPVLVDGAHGPGAFALDIPALGADWYTGNLHKWAWAPRSCGILWAAPHRQAETHPAVISWGLDQGFTAEFDWAGTRDPSPALASPEGFAFMAELGLAEVHAWNHALAWQGAQRLAEHWGTEFPVPESMVGTMATVPLPERFGATAEQAIALRDALLEEDRIEVQLHAWADRLWVRISGQVYNEPADLDRLAEAVRRR